MSWSTVGWVLVGWVVLSVLLGVAWVLGVVGVEPHDRGRQ